MKTKIDKNPIEKELDRIKDIFNRLFGAPQNILVAIVRGIEPNYFWDKNNEKVLLAEQDQELVRKLYKFVATSNLSEIDKQAVCGAAIAFLRTVSTEDEINVLKAQTGYDPASSFSIFDGLD